MGKHVLVDGNERLGWLATAVLLDIDQASVDGAADDDAYTLVMRARSELTLDEVADRLEHLTG